MDDRVLSPDDARERIEAWRGKIDKLAADTQMMSDRFQALQVTRSDQDRMTEVTVDSSGSLVALKLTREIERSSPEVVAATIMSTIRAAKAELAELTQEIIAETIGTESTAGQAIAERVGQHLLADAGEAEPEPAEFGDQDFGDQDEEPAAEAEEPLRSDSRPSPRARDEDEDEDDIDIWR